MYGNPNIKFYFLIKPVNYLFPSIPFMGAEEVIAFEGLPFYEFSNPLCTIFAWTPWSVSRPDERPCLYGTTGTQMRGRNTSIFRARFEHKVHRSRVPVVEE